MNITLFACGAFLMFIAGVTGNDSFGVAGSIFIVGSCIIQAIEDK